jgi:hypothetical protein
MLDGRRERKLLRTVHGEQRGLRGKHDCRSRRRSCCRVCMGATARQTQQSWEQENPKKLEQPPSCAQPSNAAPVCIAHASRLSSGA